MNAKQLFSVLTEIKDEYIQQAQPKQNKKKKAYFSVLAAAACLTITVGVLLGSKIYNQTGLAQTPSFGEASSNVSSSVQSSSQELAKLKLGNLFESFSAGYEGYMVYSAKDLVNQNPWQQEQLQTLPVFVSATVPNQAGIVSEPDFNKMEQLLKEVCARLHIDANEIGIQNNYPDKETIEKITEKYESVGEKVPEDYFGISELYVKTENIRVAVDSKLMATIEFAPGIALPAKYDFGFYSSYKNMKKVAEYLLEEYGDLIGMQQPVINITGGDHTYDGRQGYQISFYEGKGSCIDDVTAYNFGCITFFPSDDYNADLWMCRIDFTDISQKVGDYPIISEKQAVKLLKNGNYLTNVPYSFENEQMIRKVELVYRAGPSDSVYIPYYRFYVQLPESFEINGMYCYGAYYVPAVEEQYIENMPLWDGSFLF